MAQEDLETEEEEEDSKGISFQLVWETEVVGGWVSGQKPAAPSAA